MKTPAQLGKFFRKKFLRSLYENALHFIHQFIKTLLSSLAAAKNAEIPFIAGSLSFTTILSIVPLLAVLFSIFKLFGGLQYAYEKVMPFILSILSEGSGEIVGEYLEQFINQTSARTVGWVGMTGLLFTTITTYFTIAECFNRIWKIQKKIPITQGIVRAFTLISLAPILLTLSLAITALIAAQVKSIPFSSSILAFGLTTLLFSIVYALVPSVKIPLRIILPASIFPAALLEAAKIGYTFYTKRIVSYSAFYGSFAAIPMFLLWIYISWCITLFGAVWLKNCHENWRKKK